MQQLLGYFLLVLFVAGMTVAVLYLNDRLKRSRFEAEGGNIHEKEMRLFKLYQNLEDMLAVLDEYVEEATAEFAREREEINMLMQRLKIEIAEQEDTFVIPEKSAGVITAGAPRKSAAVSHPLPMDDRIAAAIGPRRKSRGKVEEVRRLHTGGMPEELIAKELNLSRGEVSLILCMLNLNN